MKLLQAANFPLFYNLRRQNISGQHIYWLMPWYYSFALGNTSNIIVIDNGWWSHGTTVNDLMNSCKCDAS